MKDAGSPVDVTLIEALASNPTAITEKASGAPVLANGYVVEAMMGSSSVNQAALKKATGEHSTTSTSAVYWTPSGGLYQFSLLQGKCSDPSGTANWGYRTSKAGATGYTGEVYGYESVSGAWTGYVQYYYLQSSPPYDLGDGEVPLFIFLGVDKTTGEVIDTSIAPEAPWHYNGPTNITPDYYKSGPGGELIPMRARKKVEVENARIYDVILDNLRKGKEKDAKALRDRLKSIENAEIEDYEITQDIKNADMNIIPHPMIGNEGYDRGVIMLDPVSKHGELLLEIHEAHAKDPESVESIAELITNKKIKFGPTDLVRSGPDGVICRDIKF